MQKLDFGKILRSSFGVQVGDGFTSTDLAGGLPRTRKTFEGAAHRVSIEIVFNGFEFGYFDKEFRRSVIDNGAAFEIDLPIDGMSHETHTVICLPSSISYGATLPDWRIVTMSLAVQPRPIDQGEIDIAVFAFENKGNPLERAVNELWPS